MPTVEIENKIPAALDIEALRQRVDLLRADEKRHERELHAAQSALTTSVSEIQAASYSLDSNPKALTAGVIAQSSAQRRIVAAVEMLSGIRSQLQHAASALHDAEAQLAASAAAELELDIVAALADFAATMATHAQQCTKIQILREKARDSHLLTPNVLAALNPNWAEIRSLGPVVSRLELIAECIVLPEEADAMLRTAARERESKEMAENEVAQRTEAQFRQRPHGRVNAGPPISMQYEDGRVVSRRIDE